MKRRILLIATLCLVVLCVWKLRNRPQDQDDTEGTTIAILSVNDIHSNIDLFPKFAAMVDSLREVYPDLLVFSAGDNRTGNPVNDQYNPVNYPVIALMNASGFNLSAVGNHEWDANIDNLQHDI